MINEQSKIELPKGWKWVTLGDVCKVVTGTTPSKSDSTNYGHEIPFFKPPHLWDLRIHNTEERLSFKGAEKARIVPPNTVLVTCIGNLGRTGFVTKSAAFNQQINAILENDNVDGKYIFYQAQSPLFKRQLEKLATGTTVSIVNKGNFETIIIPLPTKEIQLEIVSNIEELFSEVDKGIEDLRIAQQQLKVYRQAVLKSAFEGKLTNENLKEGKLPTKWSKVFLGEVSRVSGGLTKNAKRQSLQLQLPFLRVGNVYFNHLDLADMHTIGITQNEIDRVRLLTGDLLFVEGNGSIEQVGRVALWNGSIDNCVHQNHLIKARFNAAVISKYAMYYFMSKEGRNKIKEQANSTSGLHTLSLGKIAKLELPICSLIEQRKIIDEIESRLSVADKMEETITHSLQQAEALRQSILKKAFEGKLLEPGAVDALSQKTKIGHGLAKIVPFERKVLAGKIIQMLHKDKHFGLTKFQKVFYVAENFSQPDYETNFVKQTAGPYDQDFTLTFRKEMLEKDWVKEVPKAKQTFFALGSNSQELTLDYEKLFEKKAHKVDFVIDLLKDKNTHEAELIATLYAVWNNRLINKKPVKIDLLAEDFFIWSAKKIEEFQEEEVKITYDWMKKVRLVPKGFGQAIGIVK